jgi:hypothetical protein
LFEIVEFSFHHFFYQIALFVFCFCCPHISGAFNGTVGRNYYMGGLSVGSS